MEIAGLFALLFSVLLPIAVLILMIASLWKVFTKAGKDGWLCLIPIVNIYVMLQIAGKPGWWLILMFIPLVNVIVGIIVLISLAAAFGKGAGFAIGMLILPFIFYPLLGFGDARYLGVPSPAMA